MGVELDNINDQNMEEMIQTYLPGLSCTPEPEWLPEFGEENGKCILTGLTPPKSRSWYREQLCGNFLEKFESSKNESSSEQKKPDSNSDKPSDAVATQAGFSTQPSQPSTQPTQETQQQGESGTQQDTQPSPPDPIPPKPLVQPTQPAPPTPPSTPPTTPPTQPSNTSQQPQAQKQASSGVTASLGGVLLVLFSKILFG